VHIESQLLAAFEPGRWRVGTRGILVWGAIGYLSVRAGSGAHIIDPYALADPLLARLPMTPHAWRIGHFYRELPAGYRESISQDANLLSDPQLHARYERIRRLTRAPLLDHQRLRDIVVENLGFLGQR
jgi:arabinofuranosyltransferase